MNHLYLKYVKTNTAMNKRGLWTQWHCASVQDAFVVGDIWDAIALKQQLRHHLPTVQPVAGQQQLHLSWTLTTLQLTADINPDFCAIRFRIETGNLSAISQLILPLGYSVRFKQLLFTPANPTIAG